MPPAGRELARKHSQHQLSESCNPSQISARLAWSGSGGDERPEKKARVGGIYVGALYNPTEDIVISEEEVEDVHMDSGVEENKPLTAEEIKEGDEEEFNKMDKRETYIPVAYEKGVKVLDATWVRRRKPDGSVRRRYCCRNSNCHTLPRRSISG